MNEQKQVLVSVEGWLTGNKRMNLHLTVGLLSFSTMMFHFTTVYFFTLQLNSLALVGIFLWLGNLFAFLFDVPIWILQYYFRAKTLFLFWVISQIIAMLIFGNFIFNVTDFLIAEPIWNNVGALESVTSFFLTDILNIILMLVAALCYGFTKEVNDITNISYVLSHATPDQYKSIIARNNLFTGIGSFLWLLSAWFILTLSPKLIVFQVILLIVIIFVIMYHFFDNDQASFSIQDVKKYHVYFTKGFLEKTKENIVETVSNIDIRNTLKNTKYVFLNPIQVSDDMITVREMIDKTKESFIEIYKTLQFATDKYLIVYWSFVMLLTFGFWDTFATTFLIDFLDQVKPGWSFVLLGLIAIPAFGLQGFFWKIADKVWVFTVSVFGLILSGVSLMMMSFFTTDINMYIVMWLALINSIGYSVCMSLSVATFLETYNVTYADMKKLNKIDANASAAPMKILQNFANVVGLFLGGMILAIAGYGGFFFLFGWFILIFLGWSLFNARRIKQ